MALARAKGIAPYLVFSDKVLAVLAHERPVTKAQFSTMYGVGEAKIENGAMVISSTNCGTEEYSVQLVHPDLPMRKGHKYKLTFDIKAEEERRCIVCVSAPNAGWIRYFPDTTIHLTTEWQTFEYEFDMTEKDDNNGRLEFNMGKYGETATIYITNVRVEEISG